jgi:hypothetical protein
MNEEEFNKYVKSRYEREVAWYNRKANWNHHAYDICQWTAIILAALTPMLIVVEEIWTKWLAVGVAILVAISTGALRAFKYHENWINYRTTAETLRKEIHFYRADIQGYENVENVEDKNSLFVQRVESLISREHTLWITAHEKDEEAKRK